MAQRLDTHYHLIRSNVTVRICLLVFLLLVRDVPSASAIRGDAAERVPCEPGPLSSASSAADDAFPFAWAAEGKGQKYEPTAFYDTCQSLQAFDEAFAAINMTYKVHILRYLEDRMPAALDCESIEDMSAGALAELLSKAWQIQEIRVFRAVWRWHQKDFGRWEGKSKELLNKVHLAAIPARLLQDEVLPSKLFECALIIDALAVKIRHAARIRAYLRFAGQADLNVNVINSSLGATAMSGSDVDLLLARNNGGSGGGGIGSGSEAGASVKSRCASHPISDPSGIAVRLGREHTINSVTVHLLDDDGREYSYVVEVSLDGVNWTKVVDHSDTLVKGRVTDRFPPLRTAFVRVVGTRNTNERHKANFHIYGLYASLAE